MITIVIVTITILLSNFTYGNNIIDIKREREIEELERLKKRKNKESKEESIDMGDGIGDLI